ncbi:MAG: DNA mismatch repair endonuclease MutL, partial [Xanthobacteraceae bacterium]|nr:DNA mismatch repair endonuclease MutL [Xanthobacteraceae bacterium]
MPVRQLPENVVNRIAAGEVIERPASAVKELVENAIDAGATRVEAVISGGGRELIRVSDNGSGMNAEDLALSVERHATSKLDSEDLLNISTLGFRGEALPSIGAAARLSIATRARGSDAALEIRVEGGEKSAIRPAALAEGTRVEVRDLFYATPARLKFLKSEQAETAAVVDVIRRLALARPDVAFTIAANERVIQYPLRGTDEAGRAARLADVIGGDARANTVPVSAERDGVRLSGLAGLPTFSKANSLSQYLFVNGRPVRDKVLMGAMRGGYADLLHSGRYPVAALFIELDPHEVDVNVHPAKAEVRFRDPSLVRGLVVRALQDALSGGARRSATTGADRLVSFARPQSAPVYSSGWRGSSAPYRAGLAEAAQAAFETIAQPSADARADLAPVLQADLERPLGAARAQLHET